MTTTECPAATLARDLCRVAEAAAHIPPGGHAAAEAALYDATIALEALAIRSPVRSPAGALATLALIVDAAGAIERSAASTVSAEDSRRLRGILQGALSLTAWVEAAHGVDRERDGLPPYAHHGTDPHAAIMRAMAAADEALARR